MPRLRIGFARSGFAGSEFARNLQRGDRQSRGANGGIDRSARFGRSAPRRRTILLLRNRLFERLAQRHGYTAIVIESSFS